MREPSFDAESIAQRHGVPTPVRWVKLDTYGAFNQAELNAAILAGEGIPTQVFGANTNAVNWLWQAFNDVELMVPEADAQRAKEILDRSWSNEVEPAEEPADAPPPADQQGRLLVSVAAFDNPADLRDAQTVLASQNIVSFGPRLVLRGDRPAGVGKRFILRVDEDDLDAARTLLAEEAQESSDQPRCPRCRSWRVTRRWNLLMAVGLGGSGEFECDACHYRGAAAEFLPPSP
jgi:hypothetical protein